MLEEGIGEHFDFVELDVFIQLCQPGWQGIADEMNFMPTRGQLLAEFGSYDSAAAVRWVTRDSNIQNNLTSRPADEFVSRLVY